MMAGIITVATGLKAQNLIAHFPLDENGNSTALGGLASKTTDGEFGSEGVNFNTGTSATFNVTTSIIQHDLNPESFTLTLWTRSEGGGLGTRWSRAVMLLRIKIRHGRSIDYFALQTTGRLFLGLA